MKNYRLTQRGKIVFTGLFVVLIFAMVFSVSYLNSNLDSVGDELMINTGEIEDENKSTANQSNDINENTEEGIDALDDSEGSESSEDEKKDVAADLLEDTIKDGFSNLYTIYYAPDECDLDSEDGILLDTYYNLAIENKSKIVLEGNYHRGINYEEYMFDHLSYQRALGVKKYLVEKGIDNDRIVIVDNKGDKALNKDNTDIEIRKNRRVDIYFKDFYQ